MPYLSALRKPRGVRRGERKLLADVERVGWAVIHVFPDAGRDDPPFSYTVGLFCSFGHPEVAITGLPSDRSLPILNCVGDLVREGGAFAPDRSYDDVLEGYDVRFRSVPQEASPAYFGFAEWFYRHSPSAFPVLQLLWPDSRRAFPGDPGIDPALAAAQFLFSETPEAPR